MNKCLMVLLTCAGLCFAMQYSLRIQALGTDFAYLIPDYETDIYNNPNLMGEKLNGISYEPSLSTPLTMRVLTKRFGWFGNYWASYRYNYPQPGFDNVTSIFVNDLGMRGVKSRQWTITKQRRRHMKHLKRAVIVVGLVVLAVVVYHGCVAIFKGSVYAYGVKSKHCTS